MGIKKHPLRWFLHKSGPVPVGKDGDRSGFEWTFCVYDVLDDAWVDDGDPLGWTWAYMFTEYPGHENDLPLVGEMLMIGHPYRRQYEASVKAFIRAVLMQPYRGERMRVSDIDDLDLTGMGTSVEGIAKAAVSLGWQQITPLDRKTRDVVYDQSQRDPDPEVRRIGRANKMLADMQDTPEGSAAVRELFEEIEGKLPDDGH